MLLTLAMAWADPVIGRVRTPEGKVRVVRVAGTETDQLWLRHKRTSTWLLTIPSSAVATLNPEGHLVVTGSARAEVQLAPLGLVSATYEGPAGALILARKGAVFGVVVGHYGSLWVDRGVGCEPAELLDLAVLDGEYVELEVPAGQQVRQVTYLHQGDHPMAEEAPQLETRTGNLCATDGPVFGELLQR